MDSTPISTSAFPYTNPYTQRKTQSSVLSSSQGTPQKLFEHALEILVRSRYVPPTQNVEQVFDLLQKASEQQPCWNLSMAESLVTFAIRIFGCHENINMTGRNPEGYPSTLSFLARVLEEWSEDDSIMYAAVVQEFEVEMEQQNSNQSMTLQMSLLQMLQSLAVHFDDPIVQHPAIASLAIIWRYMDRISFLTSWKNHHCLLSSSTIDSAWWIAEKDEQILANNAVRILLQGDQDDFPKAYMYPTQREIRIAWTSILLCLLKHNHVTWLHGLSWRSKKTVSDLPRRLLEEIHRLNDPDLCTKHTVHLSIASLSLMTLMDSTQKLDVSNEFRQLVRTTKLVDNVFGALFSIFGPSSPNGARWTYEHKDAATHRWMEEFIYAWSLSKDGETCKIAYESVERHWRPHMEEFWRSLIGGNYSSQDDMSRQNKRYKDFFSLALLLFSLHHTAMRGLLTRAMYQLSSGESKSLDCLLEPSRKLIQALLFHSCQNRNLTVAICAASLLRSLLGDRASTTTHDKTSRSFWRVLEPGVVQILIRKAVKLADSEGGIAQRPLLLCILDIIDSALCSNSLLKEVIPHFEAEAIEALIHLMIPKDIRIEQMGALMDTSHGTSLGDDNADTPPVNNLSRLDEASICIEKEEEEKSVGLDHSIRLSVATLLARIGYVESNDDEKSSSASPNDGGNNLRLIQSRIRTTVADFFTASTSNVRDLESPVSPSMELTRRKFRLLVAMAVPENEEFLSSFLYSEDKEHESFFDTLRTRIKGKEEELQIALENARSLANERDSLRAAMDSQSIRFWREKQRLKKTAAEETRSRICIVEIERKKAEAQAEDLSKRLAEASDRVDEAERAAKDSHEKEMKARQELKGAREIIQIREEESKELKRVLGEKDAVISRINDELCITRERNEKLEADHGELQHVLGTKTKDIEELRGASDTMEKNLDCLFGDLVKLCQIYENQQEERSKLLSQNENLSDKLGEERSKNEANETAWLTEKELLQAEREKLEGKLAKYKQKLEDERKERRDAETKRRNYGPVSYINNLHDSVNSSTNTSRHERSQKYTSSKMKPKAPGKENDTSAPSYTSQKTSSSSRSRHGENSSSSSCLRRPYR